MECRYSFRLPGIEHVYFHCNETTLLITFNALSFSYCSATCRIHIIFTCLRQHPDLLMKKKGPTSLNITMQNAAPMPAGYQATTAMKRETQMKYETLNKVDSFLDKLLREFICVFLKSFMLTPKVLIIILIMVVMLSRANVISELISQWSKADLTLQISLIQKILPQDTKTGIKAPTFHDWSAGPSVLYGPCTKAIVVHNI